MQLPPSSGFSLRSGPAVPPSAGRPNVPAKNNGRGPWQPVSVAAAAAALGGAVVLSRPQDAFAAATTKCAPCLHKFNSFCFYIGLETP